MHSLALILFAAAFSYWLAARLRVSSIPIFIVSGIALKILGWAPEEAELRHILMLGLTFLVFVAGMELNPQRIGAQFGTAMKVGLLQFFGLGVVSFGAALAVGVDTTSALYIALAMAASSTLVIVRILQQRGQFYEPFGRLVLGVLLVQDLLVIVFISLMPNVELALLPIALNLVRFSAVSALSIFYQRFIAPHFFATRRLDEETLLLLALATLFAFIFIAHLLGLHFIVGAFLGGLALSSFPINGIVKGQLASLSDFFVAIFFVSLGATLGLPEPKTFLIAAAMAAMVVLVTPVVVLMIAESAKLTTRGALEGGLLLAQTSEFSLIVGLIGFEAGHISEELLGLIALVTVATMILTPLLTVPRLTWKLTRMRPFPGHAVAERIPERHILMLGCGQSGLALLSQLDRETCARLLIVDQDPGILKELEGQGIQVVRGDAADFRVLEACRARDAAMVISTLGKIRDNKGVLRYLDGRRVIVRVKEDSEAEIVKRYGGTPVLVAALAADDTLAWIRAVM